MVTSVTLFTRLLASTKLPSARDGRVAHDVAAARDRPALEFRGLRIEAHDGVRRRSGLAVPDDVVDRRDAVGLQTSVRSATATRSPCRSPDRAGPDSRARSRCTRSTSSLVIAMRRGRAAGIRQRILADLHRLRIDARRPCWRRTRRRTQCLLNSPPCRRDATLASAASSSLISPVFGSSRPIRLAFCTVNHRMPAPVEDQRVRICAGSGILYSVTVPVFGSSLPISDAGVSGVPDVAVLILDEAVRAGVRRRERILLDLVRSSDRAGRARWPSGPCTRASRRWPPADRAAATQASAPAMF